MQPYTGTRRRRGLRTCVPLIPWPHRQDRRPQEPGDHAWHGHGGRSITTTWSPLPKPESSHCNREVVRGLLLPGWAVGLPPSETFSDTVRVGKEGRMTSPIITWTLEPWCHHGCEMTDHGNTTQATGEATRAILLHWHDLSGQPIALTRTSARTLLVSLLPALSGAPHLGRGTGSQVHIKYAVAEGKLMIWPNGCPATWLRDVELRTEHGFGKFFPAIAELQSLQFRRYVPHQGWGIFWRWQDGAQGNEPPAPDVADILIHGHREAQQIQWASFRTWEESRCFGAKLRKWQALNPMAQAIRFNVPWATHGTNSTGVNQAGPWQSPTTNAPEGVGVASPLRADTPVLLAMLANSTREMPSQQIIWWMDPSGKDLLQFDQGEPPRGPPQVIITQATLSKAWAVGCFDIEGQEVTWHVSQGISSKLGRWATGQASKNIARLVSKRQAGAQWLPQRWKMTIQVVTDARWEGGDDDIRLLLHLASTFTPGRSTQGTWNMQTATQRIQEDWARNQSLSPLWWTGQTGRSAGASAPLSADKDGTSEDELSDSVRENQEADGDDYEASDTEVSDNPDSQDESPGSEGGSDSEDSGGALEHGLALVDTSDDDIDAMDDEDSQDEAMGNHGSGNTDAAGEDPTEAEYVESAETEDRGRAFSSAGGIKALVEVAREGNRMTQGKVVQALAGMIGQNGKAVNRAVEDGIRMLGEATQPHNQTTRRAVAGALLNRAEAGFQVSLDGTGAAQGEGTARDTASSLHVSEDRGGIQDEIIDAGGVHMLVYTARAGNEETTLAASVVLHHMALTGRGAYAMANAGGLNVLATEARDGTDRVKDRAARTLVAACRTSKRLGELWHLAEQYDIMPCIAAAGGIRALVEAIRSDDNRTLTHPPTNPAMLRALRRISRHAVMRIAITDANGIQVLAEVARDGSAVTQELAFGTLAELVCDEAQCAALAAAGGIPVLVAVARDGAVNARVQAFRALSHLARHEAQSVAIAAAEGIPALLTGARAEDTGIKTNAAAALQNMLRHADMRAGIAAAGGASILLDVAREGNAEDTRNASGALWCLAEEKTTMTSMAANGGVRVLLDIARGGNDESTGNAVGALWCMSRTADMRVAIVAAGGIPVLVDVARTGSYGVRQRAVGALSLLAGDDDKRAAIADSDGLQVLLEVTTLLHGSQARVTTLAITAAEGTQNLAEATREVFNKPTDPATLALRGMAGRSKDVDIGGPVEPTGEGSGQGGSSAPSSAEAAIRAWPPVPAGAVWKANSCYLAAVLQILLVQGTFCEQLLSQPMEPLQIMDIADALSDPCTTGGHIYGPSI